MKRLLATFCIMSFLILNVTGCTEPSEGDESTQEEATKIEEIVKEDQTGINENHPIVFFLNTGSKETLAEGTVLGGSKDDKWLNTYDYELLYNNKVADPNQLLEQEINTELMKIDLIKGNEKFEVYNKKGTIQSVDAEGLTLTVNGHTLDTIIGAKVPNIASKDEKILVGINGEWNALPRVPSINDDSTEFVADLDNDGTKEKVIISKKPSTNDNYTDAIDVSLRVETGEDTTTIEEYIIDGTYTRDYGIILLDLNGDGKLEIVRYAMGHNFSVVAFSFEDGESKEVLNHYYGD